VYICHEQECQRVCGWVKDGEWKVVVLVCCDIIYSFHLVIFHSRLLT
jgi:hypothetical protein